MSYHDRKPRRMAFSEEEKKPETPPRSAYQAVKKIIMRHHGRISVRLITQLLRSGHYDRENSIIPRDFFDKLTLHKNKEDFSEHEIQMDDKCQWLSVNKKPGPLSDSEDEEQFEIELPKRVDLDYIVGVKELVEKANVRLRSEIEDGFVDAAAKGTTGDGLPWWGDCESRMRGRRYVPTMDETNRAQRQRRKLPAYKDRHNINEVIERHQTVVIVGATGCGKSSQIPINYYEASHERILVAQPRKIAAVTLAERVAMERSEEVGKTIGYKVRYDSKASDQTKVLYCTTGCILRAMMRNPQLTGVGAVFIDEVHERDSLGDFTMLMLRELQGGERPDLKVILMSATVDPDWCLEYFEDCTKYDVGGISPYDVSWVFLEDCLLLTQHRCKPPISQDPPISAHDLWGELEPHYRDLSEQLVDVMSAPDDWIDFELIEKLVVWADEQEDLADLNAVHDEDYVAKGCILIFLPGWYEIRTLINRLKSNRKLHNTVILPFHSHVPKKDQEKVFQRPDAKYRKIIVSTNIAESSVTIDDVVYVIDSGRERMTTIEESTNVSSLRTKWIARSNAFQRQGRAGRCRQGKYFGLFSRWQFDNFCNEHEPEMQRMPLENVCLQVKAMSIEDPVETVLNALPSPPNPVVVSHALNFLATLGAFDWEGNMTRLGKKLGELPLHPSLGKLVLLGRLFQVTDGALTIASVCENKTPFNDKEQGAAQQKLDLSGGLRSDHWTYIQAHRRYKNGSSCSILNPRIQDNIEQHRKEVLRNLQEVMRIGKDAPAPDSFKKVTAQEEWAILSALLSGCLNMARLTAQFDMVCLASPPCWATTGQGSVNDRAGLTDPRLFEKGIALWHSRLDTKQLFLNDCSIVPGFGALLFGPPCRMIHEDDSRAQLMPPKDTEGNVIASDAIYASLSDKNAQRVAAIRDALLALYEEHKPDRIDGMDNLFEKYKGVEREMFCRVCDKYNVEVPDEFAESDSEDEDRGAKNIRNAARHSPYLKAENAEVMRALCELRECIAELIDLAVGRPIHLHDEETQDALLHVRDVLINYNRLGDLAERSNSTQYTAENEPWVDDYTRHKRACSNEEFEEWKRAPKEMLELWIHRELKRINKKVAVVKMNEALQWEIGTDFSISQRLVPITQDCANSGLFAWHEHDGHVLLGLTAAGRQQSLYEPVQQTFKTFTTNSKGGKGKGGGKGQKQKGQQQQKGQQKGLQQQQKGQQKGQQQQQKGQQKGQQKQKGQQQGQQQQQRGQQQQQKGQQSRGQQQQRPQQRQGKGAQVYEDVNEYDYDEYDEYEDSAPKRLRPNRNAGVSAIVRQDGRGSRGSNQQRQQGGNQQRQGNQQKQVSHGSQGFVRKGEQNMQQQAAIRPVLRNNNNNNKSSMPPRQFPDRAIDRKAPQTLSAITKKPLMLRTASSAAKRRQGNYDDSPVQVSRSAPVDDEDWDEM